MGNKTYFLQMLIFSLICAGLYAGVWWGISRLEDYREEYDMIMDERENFSSIIDRLREKNRTLQEIGKISFSNAEGASDGVEFYSEVRKLVVKNAMNMLSMSAKDSGELELKLRGNYYSLVNLFADWRRMPFASRITSLRITRDSIEPDNLVDADITLEAWIEK